MNTKLKTLDVAFYITNISSTCTGTPTFNLYELVVCSSLMHFHTGLGFRLGFRLGLGLGLGTTSRGFYSSININPFPPRGFPLMSKILGH